MIKKVLAILYTIITFFSQKMGEIEWGCTEFLGPKYYWFFSRMPLGFQLTGGTGTGKSKRLLLMLVASLFRYRWDQKLSERWAALIIDPKITFAKVLADLKFPCFEDIWVLDDLARYPMNVVRSNLPSPTLAKILSECRHAGADLVKSSGSAFFETMAEALLGYLIDLGRLTDTPSLATIDAMLRTLVRGGSLTSSNPAANNALVQIESIMAGKPGDVAGILTSVDHVIEPFRRSPWRKMFYEEGPFILTEARDKGRIVVCLFTPSTPHLTNGLFLLKALWFHLIMERLNPDFQGNRERYCFYICDEFHRVARPGSESAFFDIRREAKGVPIVAFQQLSQLQKVLGPIETETVLGLLSVKIPLRNSDPETNEYYSKLGGEIDVWMESLTTSTTPSIWSSLSSQSTTGSWHRKRRIPPEFFFDLPDGDAVIFEAGKKPFYLWFPDIYMSPEDEKKWRKKHWPNRPHLSKPPRFLR
jgi:hypothetical protein